MKCLHCNAPGVVETPVGEGSALMCWPCSHRAIGDESAPVFPEDAEREERRLATVAAFESTIRPCLGYLRGVALRLTRNAEDADDVVQEALIKAFAAWSRFDVERSPKSWLAVIVKRCFVDEWRRWGRRADRPGVASDRWEDASHDHESWADYLDAQRAITGLGADQRAVLELAMIGTPYEEIAERLEIPVGTVMSRLHRARRAVEAAL